MGQIFSTLITNPLGYILTLLYTLTSDYGFSIILFTIAIKIVLFPLTLKQQKSMVEMQKIQPHMNELKAKYKNDKEKLNEETMKLYKEHNVNPLGGCLPLLLQFPILIGLYQVIYHPLVYLQKLSKEQIFAVYNKLVELKIPFTPGITLNTVGNHELEIAKKMIGHFDVLNAMPGIKGLFEIKFQFLQIFDLSLVPKLPSNDWPPAVYIPLLFIPIIAALVTFFQSKITPTQTNANADDTAASMQKNMMYMFPVMTLFFAFSMPAGLGIYWIISGVVQIIQQLLLNKYYVPHVKGGGIAIEKKTNRKSGKNR